MQVFICLLLVSFISAQYSANLTNYAIIAATTVASAGSTYVIGDVAISPGTSNTGLVQGWNVIGSIRITDPAAIQAQQDLNIAFNVLGNLTASPTLTGTDLATLILNPGVYNFTTSAITLSGNLTLNGTGPFVFQISTTFITSNNCHIILLNGATASHIYFQVGSSITIGTGCIINGLLLAGTSITVNGATVNGGLYAKDAAVTITQSSIILAVTPYCYIGPTVVTVPDYTTCSTVHHSAGSHRVNIIHFVLLALAIAFSTITV
ncbi:unnamed protein product [Didymodactylos carnosus]|uniref:Antifreeze protein n=2 Tax=Didymodactylos carnosus TaxID=1234261 RepID=A0A8S2NFB9_9BILA|nr:unnamed protein product [Didymodactylos carnosus]CAF3997718.1 unnamed protein product [Didymodactylos carnosus]